MTAPAASRSTALLDGICPYRSLAAGVLALGVADGRRCAGWEWMLERGDGMRFWCQVAGLSPEYLAERLTARITGCGCVDWPLEAA